MTGIYRPLGIAFCQIIIVLLLMSPATSIGNEQPAEEQLYISVHHAGLYTGHQTDAQSLVEWYTKHFGFKFKENPNGYFALFPNSGSLEIMKREPDVKGHLAIEVSDFEAARQDLLNKGFELMPTITVGPVSVSYIKGTDPAGYKVHLFHMKK